MKPSSYFKIINMVTMRKSEATAWFRKLYKGIHNLYSLPDIIKVIKSGRTGWAGHVVIMRMIIKAYKV
jgi:hypothetical protein